MHAADPPAPESPELGWGTWQLIETAAAGLFAHRCDWEDSTVIAAHNLGDGRVTLTLGPDQLGEAEAVDDLLRERTLGRRADGSLRIALEPFGHRWLRVRGPGQRPRFFSS